MKHVIDMDPETVIELRLPSVEGAVDESSPTLELRLVPLDWEADADTAGFAQGGIQPGPKPGFPPALLNPGRLVIVCAPHPGPPPVEQTSGDVQGFKMKEYENKGGYPTGDPFGGSSGGGGTPFPPFGLSIGPDGGSAGLGNGLVTGVYRGGSYFPWWP